jgi:hypothetical protein
MLKETKRLPSRKMKQPKAKYDKPVAPSLVTVMVGSREEAEKRNARLALKGLDCTDFTLDGEGQLEQLLDYLMGGGLLKEWCGLYGLSYGHVRLYLKREGLETLVNEAQAVGADALAEDMIITVRSLDSVLIRDDKQEGGLALHPATALNRLQLISKSLSWYLEKRNPEKYGAKVEVQNSGLDTFVQSLNAAWAKIDNEKSTQG